MGILGGIIGGIADIIGSIGAADVGAAALGGAELGGAVGGGLEGGAAAALGDAALGGAAATDLAATAAPGATSGATSLGAAAPATSGAAVGGVGAGVAPNITDVLATGDINIPANATFTSGAIPTNLSEMDMGAFQVTDSMGNVVNTGDLNMPAAAAPDTSPLAYGPGPTGGAGDYGLPAEITSGASAPTPGNIGATAFAGGDIGTAGADVGAAATGAGGGSSILSNLNSAISSPLAKLALGAAPLAYTLLKGQPQIPQQTQQLNSSDTAALSLAQTDLALVNANQLTPAQQAQINQTVQQQTNQLRQQYLSMGRDPDTDSGYLAGVQQIQNNALAMQQQMIQTTLQAALGSMGAASQNVLAMANLQVQEDTQYQQAISNAFTAMGRIIGGGTTINLKG